MDSLQFHALKIVHWERGVVVKRYDLMHYDVLIPGRAHPWGEISPMQPTWFEEGEVVTIALVEGRPIPVILNRKQWLSSGVPDRGEFWTRWDRLGARSLSRWLVPELDQAGSSVQIGLQLDAVESAEIVRLSSDSTIVALGASLSGVDLGDQIVSMHLDESDTAWAVTHGTEVVVVDCEAVRDQAWETAFFDFQPYVDGQTACFNEEGYVWEAYFAMYLEANPMPDEHDFGCVDAWEAGLREGYQPNFDSGYTDQGCEIE